MNTNSRVSVIFFNVLLIVAVVIVAVVVVTVVTQQKPSAPPAATGGTTQPLVVREDTRILDNPANPEAVLVEFLDFECEACGAFKPYVEQIRQQYAGRIQFAVRYFPLPSHGNSMNAAIAAESAAQQGRLEDMYNRLFETQAQWGERGAESQAALFRTFAQDLGLDMAAFDAAVADPATAARVQSDVDDGRALGVDSTPTFFLDGQRVELNAYEDLQAAVEAALAG